MKQRRRFEIGDRVRARTKLHKVEPGTIGTVVNVDYARRGRELLSLAVHFDDGRRAGLRFKWTFDHLELVSPVMV